MKQKQEQKAGENLQVYREFFRTASKEYYGDQDETRNAEAMEASNNAGYTTTRKHVVRVFARAAIVVGLLVIFLGLATVYQISQDQSKVYADWGILHRLVATISGGITTDQEPVDDEYANTVISSITITDETKIEDGKNEFPQMYLPSYIPEGYVLKELVVERYGNGVVGADYEFVCGEELLHIGQGYIPSENITFQSHSQAEDIRLDDRLLRVLNSGEAVEMYTEYGSLTISGTVDQDEMVKVAKGLVQ